MRKAHRKNSWVVRKSTNGREKQRQRQKLSVWRHSKVSHSALHCRNKDDATEWEGAKSCSHSKLRCDKFVGQRSSDQVRHRGIYLTKGKQFLSHKDKLLATHVCAAVKLFNMLLYRHQKSCGLEKLSCPQPFTRNRISLFHSSFSSSLAGSWSLFDMSRWITNVTKLLSFKFSVVFRRLWKAHN